MLQDSEPYKELKSQPAQQTLKVLDKTWKSYFVAIKDWKKHPEKYLGMPRLPNYKEKNGRFPWYIKNNTCYVDEHQVLHFQVKRLHGVTFQTRTDGRLLGVRFIPRGSVYVMEVIFEIEVPDAPTGKPTRIAGIDLGVNNLVTLANNIGERPIIINGRVVKSINQYFNKRKAVMQSELMLRSGKRKSRKIEDLSYKRHNRIKTHLHKASRMTVDWCIDHGIDTLVCGLNKGWKQECVLNKPNTQKFVYIPYNTLIKQLEYKCQSAGIRFVLTDEAYTSGTSFLDGEQPIQEQYNRSRRKKRGLFQAADRLINADVNGALQIIKKVVPNAFGYGIGAVNLTPLILEAA
jgi:putative transposase